MKPVSQCSLVAVNLQFGRRFLEHLGLVGDVKNQCGIGYESDARKVKILGRPELASRSSLDRGGERRDLSRRWHRLLPGRQAGHRK